jgi:hypothetical protein
MWTPLLHHDGHILGMSIVRGNQLDIDCLAGSGIWVAPLLKAMMLPGDTLQYSLAGMLLGIS